MMNDFNFLSKHAKKEIKKSTDWFVNPFVFSRKLVIFIEKRRSLGSSFFVSVFARDLSFKDRLSEVVCGT